MGHATVTEIQEDYLETIHVLRKRHGVARLSDIAQHLGLGKSTVSTTLQILKRNGMVVYEPYRTIDLTPAGKRIAKAVYHRHKVLRRFLMDVLLVEEKLADETACKMEHGLSPKVVERLVHFTEFVESCPHSERRWLDGFGYYCADGSPGQCEQCRRAHATDTPESGADGGSGGGQAN